MMRPILWSHSWPVCCHPKSRSYQTRTFFKRIILLWWRDNLQVLVWKISVWNTNCGRPGGAAMQVKFFKSEKKTTVLLFYILFISIISNNLGNTPDTLSGALLQCPQNFFPGLHSLFKIFLTLPVSSATAERSFSALRQIKSHLRSTMGESRLSGLATIFIHNSAGYPMNLDRIVDIFASTTRRLPL